MRRSMGLGLLTIGLAAALLPAAEEPGKDKPGPPVSLKKKEKNDATPRPAEEGLDDPTGELLARVAKNMGTSEERLKNQDPGEKTRKIQDQIVKDLDDLIKKTQEQQEKDCNGSASAGSSSNQSKSANGKRSTSKGHSPRGSQSQGSQEAKKSGGKSKPKEGTQKKSGGKDQKDQAADGNKKEGQGKDQAASKKEGKAGKEASASTQGGGGTSSAQKKNTIADLFRDVWGHLPETKRQEMDAYSRERFMPKYDELLRQYYRTISEQGRKKDGE